MDGCTARHEMPFVAREPTRTCTYSARKSCVHTPCIHAWAQTRHPAGIVSKNRNRSLMEHARGTHLCLPTGIATALVSVFTSTTAQTVQHADVHLV